MTKLLNYDEFINESKAPFFKVNDEVDYHGRSGKVTDIQDSHYIVYFEDEEEEIAIDIEELEEQNDIKDEDDDIIKDEEEDED